MYVPIFFLSSISSLRRTPNQGYRYSRRRCSAPPRAPHSSDCPLAGPMSRLWNNLPVVRVSSLIFIIPFTSQTRRRVPTQKQLPLLSLYRRRTQRLFPKVTRKLRLPAYHLRAPRHPSRVVRDAGLPPHRLVASALYRRNSSSKWQAASLSAPATTPPPLKKSTSFSKTFFLITPNLLRIRQGASASIKVYNGS